MGFNFDSFRKGLMCQNDVVPRIHWPAAPSVSALHNKTKLKQPQDPFLYPSSIISIDRKGLLQQMDRKVNLYGAQLECRWVEMNLNVTIDQREWICFIMQKSLVEEYQEE